MLTSHPASNPDAVTKSELVGFFSAPSRRFQLRSNIDRTARPGNRTMMVINGTFDASGGQLSGMMVVAGSPAVKFQATRGGTESAKPASPAPPAAPAAPAQTTTTIDGVYNGTYTGGAGPRTLKLALRTFDHGTLAGVFTFYDPPTSHEHAYSFSMIGKFEPRTGKFSLEPPKWLMPAPGYFMVGIAGTFDANAGKVTGNLTSGRHGPFEATRDATSRQTSQVSSRLPRQPRRRRPKWPVNFPKSNNRRQPMSTACTPGPWVV